MKKTHNYNYIIVTDDNKEADKRCNPNHIGMYTVYTEHVPESANLYSVLEKYENICIIEQCSTVQHMNELAEYWIKSWMQEGCYRAKRYSYYMDALDVNDFA